MNQLKEILSVCILLTDGCQCCTQGLRKRDAVGADWVDVGEEDGEVLWAQQLFWVPDDPINNTLSGSGGGGS